MGNLMSAHDNEQIKKISHSSKKTPNANSTAQGNHSIGISKESLSTSQQKESTATVQQQHPPEDTTKIFKEIFPPPKFVWKVSNSSAVIRRAQSSNQIVPLDNVISEIEFKNHSCNCDNSIPHNNSDILNDSDLPDPECAVDQNEQKESSSPEKVSVCNNTNIDFELNCIKSGEDIRRSYIAKLISKKVWKPTIKEKDHNTLIIFDWDDTLLCTSFLTPNGIFSDSITIDDKDLEKLKKLDSCVSVIIKMAISKGDTYIITNAAPGWVEYSAKRFYPEVAKSLNQVTIVSARGEFEKKYPGDSRQWKILAFLEMLKNLDTNLVTNLICLGDSIIEMEAAHILASKFSQAFIKTIKFRESPKPDELQKQLNLIRDQFDKIFSAVKNLTIRVEKKGKDKDKDKDKEKRISNISK